MSEERTVARGPELGRWLFVAALLLIGVGLYFVVRTRQRAAGAARRARGADERIRSASPCPTAACARSRPAPRRGRSPRASAPGWPARPWRPGSNGAVWDLDRPLERDATLAILTERDPDALERAAPLVAPTSSPPRCASCFPAPGIGFGPPIEDGFYYDFQVDRPFTPEDLERIEARMARGGRAGLPVRARGGGPGRGQPPVRRRSAQARAHHRAGRRRDHHGLHRRPVSGPLPRARTSRAPAGSSTSSCCTAAGAYWRGDERRQMLQRIYGTAWFKKEELDAYLHRLEEARKRDHRRVGRELDLFTFHPSAPGRRLLDRAGDDALQPARRASCGPTAGPGFQEIKTPLLYNKMLWEMSGHWGKYRENMFLVLDKETGEHDCVAQADELPVPLPLYGTKKHSYRELPLRYVTFDVLHRNEVSGALSGLTRVRQFAQDDCHVFLTDGADRGRGEVPDRTSSSSYYAHVRARGQRSSSPPGPSSGSASDEHVGPGRGRRSAAALEADRRCRTSSSRATARSTGPRSTST